MRPIARRRVLILGLAAIALLVAWRILDDALTPGPVPDPVVTAHVSGRLVGHTGMVWQVVFRPDGEYLASAGVDGTVKLWHWRTGELARSLAHPVGVTAVAFSPDGVYLATGSYDRSV